MPNIMRRGTESARKRRKKDRSRSMNEEKIRGPHCNLRIYYYFLKNLVGIENLKPLKLNLVKRNFSRSNLSLHVAREHYSCTGIYGLLYPTVVPVRSYVQLYRLDPGIRQNTLHNHFRAAPCGARPGSRMDRSRTSHETN